MDVGGKRGQCRHRDELGIHSRWHIIPHPAWPLVDGALPAPDDLLTFVRSLCRHVGDPKPSLSGGNPQPVAYVEWRVVNMVLEFPHW